jgi:DNA-binding XRE family transcriptional regulator
MEQKNFILLSRTEAISRGLRHYFTGKPCKRGHIALRFATSMDCVVCSKNRQQSEKIKTYKSKNYLKNRDIYLNKSAENYKNNKSKKLAYAKQYQQENIKKILVYQSFYKAEKAKNNPSYKLALSIKASISATMRRIGKTKGKKSTLKFIGCSLEDLKIHIEKQFTQGMNWENRDQWHVDHIVPLATAKNEQDVIALNHFSNLRPLWAKENLQKGSKLNFLI